MESKLRKYLSILALGLAGGSIYCLPYIKYILYDAQIKVMDISNTQSGLLMTMYTIGNMILYIPGGIIADRVSPKKAISISLLATTVLGIVYAFNSSFVAGMVIWLGFSVTTAFVFWASLLKAVRLIGTEEEQGFLYGCYYACNGIASSLTNWIGMKFYSAAGGDIAAGFRGAVISIAIIPAIAAVMLILLLKENRDTGSEQTEDPDSKFKFSDVGVVLKNPIVWILSITVLIGYGFYTSSSYFTPYLTAVKGISAEDSGLVSIIRNNLLLLLSPLGGLLADKVFKSTAKWLATSFIILAALYGICMILPSSMSGGAASVYTLLPAAAATMMYGVIWSTVSEARIPRKLTGTVIGIASIIGYLPDSIYALLFGQFIDRYGNNGYNFYFIFLIITGLVGCVLAIMIFRMGKKNRAAQEVE